MPSFHFQEVNQNIIREMSQNNLQNNDNKLLVMYRSYAQNQYVLYEAGCS